MELNVFWTDNAIEKLEDIFDFLKITANVKVAKKVVNSIVKSTEKLIKHPKIGQIEELLKDRKNEYRYLVVGNYKVIYWIDNLTINIATVFDCRQNPILITINHI